MCLCVCLCECVYVYLENLFNLFRESASTNSQTQASFTRISHILTSYKQTFS